jgi:hypothetical protein
MSELRYLVLVVFCIDAALLFGQYGADTINPGGTHIINYEGSSLQGFDSGNYTLNEDTAASLPGGASSVSPTTGNIFTDAFTTLRNWLLSVPGVGFIIAAATALPNWLKSFGLDPFLAFLIGAVWHGYAIFLLVEFLTGR